MPLHVSSVFNNFLGNNSVIKSRSCGVRPLSRRSRQLPLKGKATAAAYEGVVRAERMNPFPTKFVAAAAAIESHLIRRKRHLPLKGKAMTYLRHVSGAKRTSMGKISRRPRNMSKHRTALLIILSPETPMVKVFESMP